MAKQRLTAVLALLGLGIIMVAVPWLLIWATTHVRLRFNLGSPDGFWQALTSRDDGTMALWLLTVVGAIAWAILAGAILIEIASHLRHLPVPQLRGFGVPQTIAHTLVAAALGIVLATNNGGAALQAAAAPIPVPVDAGGTGSHQAAPQAHPRPVDDKADIYVVKKGDTLWDIADDKLGNPRDYPEIFKASRHTVQRDGRHLVDADLIYPGWRLTIPDDHPDKPTRHPRAASPVPRNHAAPPAPATTAPAPVPASTAPIASTATPMESATPATNPEPTTQTGEVDSADQFDDATPLPWMLAGLGGTGALLAGGLWLRLRRRRAAQFRLRRPGRTITVPSEPALATVEKTLRHQGDLTSDLVDRIAQTNQRLAATLHAADRPIPVLFGVDVIYDQLTYRFTAPVDLPQPWEAGDSPCEWCIRTDSDPDRIGAWGEEHERIWPTLVTLGQDAVGWRLINLETLGVITLTGDRVNAEDLLRYWIAELSVAHWGRDIEIAGDTLIAGLPALIRHRLWEHNADEPISDLIEVAKQHDHWLEADGLAGIDTARAAQAGPELWRPHLLITASDKDGLADLVDLAVGRPGRTGITVIRLEADGASPIGTEIRLTDKGRVIVPSLGLDLVANGITADEAEGCAALLDAAEDPFTDAPMPDLAEPDTDWQQHCDAAGHLHADLVIPRGSTLATLNATSVLPQEDLVLISETANTVEDLAEIAPLVPPSTTATVTDADPRLDHDLADWRADTCDRPRLCVLGPVRLRLGRGGQPSVGIKRVPYYTEIAAYLATRPHGATTDELVTALGVTAERVRVDLHTLRARLGINPTTDRYFVPNATDNPEAGHRGEGTYLIEDLLCDAHLFRRLRLRGEASGTDGIEDLAEALRLAAGAPYEQLRRQGGLWLAESHDDQHLLVGIIDVAHLLTTHALAAGDLRRARAAAELAHAIAPDEVTPQLDLAVIAEHEGSPSAADRIAHEAIDWLDGTGQGPLDTGQRADAILRAHRRLERQGRTG